MGLMVSWLGAGTLLIGVFFALAQHDLKRLLAFHTVSQIGYMMLGLGLGTPLGIAAGLFHCLNHACSRAASSSAPVQYSAARERATWI